MEQEKNRRESDMTINLQASFMGNRARFFFNKHETSDFPREPKSRSCYAWLCGTIDVKEDPDNAPEPVADVRRA